MALGDAQVVALGDAPDGALDDASGMALSDAPVVVIGNGPAGMKIAADLARLQPDLRVLVFGEEESNPYQRVRLSSLLAGQSSLSDLYEGVSKPTADQVEMRLGVRIERVFPKSRQVLDDQGQLTAYSKLVFATGSHPAMPEIPGLNLAHVFTFRSLADAESLMARQIASRHTVVLGGGLLGLEAAKAMARYNTQVTVIEGGPRLMPRQLDEQGAALLCDELNALGIRVLLNESVRNVAGQHRVESLKLRSGLNLSCDTLIVATGIRPRVELARMAGVRVGRGIQVDDRLQTNLPDVFAIGECAEHRGQIYGLVAPGLEQATVAARALLGLKAQYLGSQLTTKLKVMSTPVFSVGVFGEHAPPEAKTLPWTSQDGRQYVCLTLLRGRLIGALAVGGVNQTARLQEAVVQGRLLMPWQIWRFQWTGQLWGETRDESAALWPDSTVVCSCTGVTCGQLRKVIDEGARSVIEIKQITGASGVCGSCQPKLSELCGSAAKPVPALGAVAMSFMGLGLGVVTFLLLMLPSWPMQASRDVELFWDWIWRDSFAKQWTGYGVLFFMACLALLGVPKRFPKLNLGSYPVWRLLHVVLGVLVLVAWAVHSGGRLGYNLNLVLSLSVFVALLAGALLSLSLGRQHENLPQWTRVRKVSHWLHVLSLWSLPTLLSFHVLKFYFFGGWA